MRNLICPECGAYLDPGEICDCGEKGEYLTASPVTPKYKTMEELKEDLIKKNGRMLAYAARSAQQG